MDLAVRSAHQRSVDLDVAPRHCQRGVTLLEDAATAAAIDFSNRARRGDCAGLVVHDESCNAVFHDFADGPAAIGDDGRSAGKSFDHHQAERLRPVDREQQRSRIANEVVLLVLTDLAGEVDQRMRQQGLYLAIEVALVERVDLGGDSQADAAGQRDLDGAVDPLFRGDAPDKGEIVLGLGVKNVQIGRQSMVDGGAPTAARELRPLAVRDRDQVLSAEMLQECRQIGRVEPTMHRGHARAPADACRQDVQIIDVKVNQVE